MATFASTPLGVGFDSYFGYLGAFNDYLHSWSYHNCPNIPRFNRTITFDGTPEQTKCTSSSVHARHLQSVTDLWLNDHPVRPDA